MMCMISDIFLNIIILAMLAAWQDGKIMSVSNTAVSALVDVLPTWSGITAQQSGLEQDI